MNRRDFLKHASIAAVGASAVVHLGAESKRLAFGGIQIECSTYGNILSRFEDFTIRRGDELAGHPLFRGLKRYPYPFVPLLLATAVPGGRVERKTYDTIKAEFLDRLTALLPLDGLYLAMHGAMYVDGMTDAEGDWIAAVRGVVGPQCLITASYDLHGNVSQRVIDNLDMFSAFRTAPHIDREETTKRACDMLIQCLDTGIRPTLMWAPVPVLMPGERSSTLYDPAKRLYATVPTINAREGILDASLMVGYVWADERRATACSVVTGTTAPAVHAAARDLAQLYWDARKEFAFGVPTGTLAECITKARTLPTQPVVISDSGDNPTGGGTGDRADALAELLRLKATDVLLAGIADRPATEACYAAGVGKTLTLTVGASLDPKQSTSITVTATVVFLAQVDKVAERQAVVQTDGVTYVLTARRRPFHYIPDFTSLGLDPKAYKILVVKAGYLVPDIAAIANPNLMALTDGAVNQDIEHLASVHRVPTFPFRQDVTYTPNVFVSARSKR